MSKNVEWGEVHGEGVIVSGCDECGKTDEYDFYDADDMGENFKSCQSDIQKKGWISRKIDDEWYDFCCEACYQKFLARKSMADDTKRHLASLSHKTSVSVKITPSERAEGIEVLDGEFSDTSYDDDRKMTNVGVQQRIEQEGLGYALLDWRIEGRDCRNPKLGKLIDEAYGPLKRLTEYLKDVIKRQDAEKKEETV